MAMDRESFNSLCARIAAALSVQDASAVERGEVFLVDGIECQLHYLTGRGSALASLELGDALPGTELDLYRQLLEIQSMLVGHMDAMFVRDPINGSVLFTVRIALVDEVEALGFVEALRGLAAQVRRWRDTVMRGQFVDYVALADEVMSGQASQPMMGA